MAKKKREATEPAGSKPEELPAAAAAVEAAEAEEAAQETGSDEESAEELKERLKRVIGVEVGDAGVLRKRLKISVPAETIAEERDKQYSELFTDALVPGFRRGRAPRRLVEKRFAQEVGEQVQLKLMTNAYLAATEKESIKPLGDPQVWIRGTDGNETLTGVEAALRKLTLPDEGPFEFRCEVEVWPEFTLPEWKGLKIKRPKVAITEGDITKQLDRMRAYRGQWEPVAKGTAKTDDLLVCDVTMRVGGEVIRKQENTQVYVRPQQIEGVTLEKLGETLAGAKAGDTRQASGTVPADHERAELREKSADFEFQVHEVKRFALPPVDKEFLDALGFESEAEAREYLKARMERELTDAVQTGMRNQLCRALLEKTAMELPEGISRRHIDRAIVRKVVELRRNGVPEEAIAKHADELRTSAAKQAIESLKLQFVLEEISTKLEIEVSEEELNSQIAEIARQYNRRFDRVRDELAQGDGLTALYVDIRDRKCLDRLLEDAEIEETSGPAESVSAVADAT
ncbi:MAG: trigger factor [Phycisphaerae bacterium]